MPAWTTLAAVEREHVLKVLALSEGNRTKAARALGIHRRQLYRLMEKYGIEED